MATAEDILWADAVVFGSPTRFGNVASQLKQFIDTLGGQWVHGLLADKVYSGFTATSTAHGGQESTLLALYNTVHHFGGLVVAPGYTDPSKFRREAERLHRHVAWRSFQHGSGATEELAEALHQAAGRDGPM